MPAKQQAGKAVGFNFGDLSNYSSGGGIPEGDYVWTDLSVQMYQAKKQDTGANVGPARLGVMITLVPLAGGDERTQFYSLGSNADKSWAPNPETGKGIVAIPGGPGTPPNASTNWAVLVKSLMDSGLPNGILQDDLSVLEGIHVHMANVPEPEERKGFVAKTGEAADDNRPKTIAVVTEIKDDGKPWEGTGGVPEAKAAVAPNGSARSAAKKSTAASASTATAASESDDVLEAAINGASEVLGKSPNGCTKLLFRTGTFKAVNTAVGQEMAQKVINTYFSSDDKLNSLLQQLGYEVSGTQVKASA